MSSCVAIIEGVSGDDGEVSDQEAARFVIGRVILAKVKGLEMAKNLEFGSDIKERLCASQDAPLLFPNAPETLVNSAKNLIQDMCSAK